MDTFDFQQGSLPLLVSMPHSGTLLPEGFASRLSARAQTLPDTDWHLSSLYDFVANLGASVLQANFSRYVVDLNRPPDNQSLYPGQVTTGLCPSSLFDGEELYQSGQHPDADEIIWRTQTYWQPYHYRLTKELQRLRLKHGYVLLYDAHSIRSRVPRLFDNQLPDINFGTANGNSCQAAIRESISSLLKQQQTFSHVTDGRFVGGYITRHYGQPASGCHAVQVELSQINYMDEDDFRYLPEKADKLKSLLREIFQTLLNQQVLTFFDPPA